MEERLAGKTVTFYSGKMSKNGFGDGQDLPQVFLRFSEALYLWDYSILSMGYLKSYS